MTSFSDFTPNFEAPISNALSVAGLSARLANEVMDATELAELAVKLIREQMKFHHTDTGGDAKRSTEVSNALSDLDDSAGVLRGMRDEYLKNNPFARQLSETYQQAHGNLTRLQKLPARILEWMATQATAPYSWALNTGPCRIRLVDTSPLRSAIEQITHTAWIDESDKLENQEEQILKQRCETFPNEKVREEWEKKTLLQHKYDAHKDNPVNAVVAIFAKRHPAIYKEIISSEKLLDYPPELIDPIRREYAGSLRYEKFQRLIAEEALKEYALGKSQSLEIANFQEAARSAAYERRNYSQPAKGAQEEAQALVQRMVKQSTLYVDLRPDGSVSVVNNPQISAGTRVVPLGTCVNHWNLQEGGGLGQRVLIDNLLSNISLSVRDEGFTTELQSGITDSWGIELFAVIFPPNEEPYIGVLGEIASIEELPAVSDSIPKIKSRPSKGKAAVSKKTSKKPKSK